MSQCLNPNCLIFNSSNTTFCQKCGSKIILQERYRALKAIGQGGFGKTFLAVDEGKPSKPYCVIKQFFPAVQDTKNVEKASQLFAQEAVFLERLGNHPQIPELLSYFNHEKRQYLVQEYIDGKNLTEELEEHGVFDESEIRILLLDILEVLKFAHSNQVIHRDVKPENIIRRTSDRKLVLVDFGAAKSINIIPLDVRGTIIGSAEYVAPEQAIGRAGPSSDLYSLGVTGLKLLTNISIFNLYDPRKSNWYWRDFLKNNPVSEELAIIIDKLVEKVTSKRYQSAVQVLQDLKPAPKIEVETFNKEFTIPPPLKPRISISQLKIFSFEVVTVTDVESSGFLNRNKIVKTNRVRKQAQYLTANLGDDIAIDFVYIPEGTFIMGSPTTEVQRYNNEGPRRRVKVSAFFLSKYLITQAQYQAIMGNNPSKFKGTKCPVECVSWQNAVDYCEELSRKLRKDCRLPSEAEWEYACRASTTDTFHFGETISTDLANYNGEYTYCGGPLGEYREKTTEVGIFPPNNFGLYDLHGNVWEWCLDTWHKNYEGAPNDGSAWINTNTTKRLLRGGSWRDVPGACRSAIRVNSLPNHVADDVGFRVLLV